MRATSTMEFKSYAEIVLQSTAMSAARQSYQTADSAPDAATRGVTLSTRHFRVAIYAETLCACMMS